MSRKDDIITSSTAERMLSRASPIYDNSYIGLCLFEAIGLEYDKLWYVVNTFADQLFPETATWAIELWERRYGIEPTAEQTLDDRRQKILAMRTLPKSVNPHSIATFIRAVYGRDTEIMDNIAPYTFGVYVSGSDPRPINAQDIRAYLNRHKASHMSYELGFGSVAVISIGIETAFYRYSWELTGTAETGTLPQTNIQAGIESSSINASHEAVGYSISFPLCGTCDTGTI